MMTPAASIGRVFPALASLVEVKARGDAARAVDRKGVPAVDFGPDLALILVLEDGETLTWVDVPLLESFSGDVFAIAQENLRRRTQRPLRRKQVSPQHGLWIVGEDDGLSSGRLLLHDLWAPIKASLPGELLVRVPSRGVVIAYSNVASDMAFADRVANHYLDQAIAAGAPTVTSDWLVWLPTGWGKAEL